MSKIEWVIKRTGDVVPFNKERITNAIYRAAVAVGGRDRSIAEGLTDQVVEILERTVSLGQMPMVEEIQDIVEKVLIENGHARTAKAYILYREERSAKRRSKTAHQNRDSSNIPYRKLWETLSWAVDHDVHTVERLNARLDPLTLLKRRNIVPKYLFSPGRLGGEARNVGEMGVWAGTRNATFGP